jgi:hypothetical protein
MGCPETESTVRAGGAADADLAADAGLVADAGLWVLVAAACRRVADGAAARVAPLCGSSSCELAAR